LTNKQNKYTPTNRDLSIGCNFNILPTGLFLILELNASGLEEIK
jgi:hypothetical protein